ncbi:MAG: hypothetical protein CRN43_17575 [Candidatus Nephrothrix sp. EaCA]|nr:MAG: hypothetical protein CRN43_17575 [Candidatus Nephrothrix sp. EaCA]
MTNPFQIQELSPFVTYYVDDYERHNYYFANAYAEIDFPFLKGLSYRLNFGNNYRTDKHYYASQFDNGSTGRAYKEDEQYYDYMLDNILNYKKIVGKHEVGVTLLYGAIERHYDRTYTEGVGFSRVNLSYHDLGSGAKVNLATNAYKESLLYQMARLNYKYKDTYLLTATIRKDGYSGFSKDNKSAIFPTVALAWILSNERFIHNVRQINQLKLRAGYGENGNQTSRLSSLAKVTTVNNSEYYTAYIFGDGGSTAFGQRVTSLGNDKLRWERTKGLNVGLDLIGFKNKTQVTLDLYNNNTDDLLYYVPVPLASGFSGRQSNIGKINNRGLEMALTQQVLNRGNFNWAATLNFSTNQNKIVTLTGQDIDKDGKEDDLVSAGLFIGKSIGAIYDYEATRHIYNLTDRRLPGFSIGSMSYVDQNGDGDITADKDRVFLGRKEPAYRASLMNHFSYKGVSLSLLLNSIQGGQNGFLGISAPNNSGYYPMYFREDNSVRINDFVGLDYWSPRTPHGQYPRNISGTRSKVETPPYESRSFVRLQDISLSYNLASLPLLKKIKAQSIKVYVSGKNLYTWTKWKGFDPESLDDNGNPVGAFYGGRPVLRAFTVGCSLVY